MNQGSERGEPLAALFHCERLKMTVSRLGCVIRRCKSQDRAEVSGNEPHTWPLPNRDHAVALENPHCVDCAAGAEQVEILRAENERRRANGDF
jgi:hypothetical protein